MGSPFVDRGLNRRRGPDEEAVSPHTSPERGRSSPVNARKGLVELGAKPYTPAMTRPMVRFAPSPTGHLHIGNARPALLNALFARRERGTFVLRFDDTDLERSKREYADAIERDLAWLGIPPDVVVRQSERFPLYDDAAERLRIVDRLYPCYE